MAIRILKLSQMSAAERATLMRRAELDIDQALPIAQEVIDRIRESGDEGVVEYARKFDYEGAIPQNLKVTETEFNQAWKQITPELKTAIDQAFSNIKDVHQRQMPEEINLAQIKPGIFAGEKISPIPSVGLYVPRGKGAFPSMMLMLTIPAKVADVPNIVVCTPPDKNGTM